MPQIVDVVGFGEVEFPDDFTDDQIRDVVRRKLAPPTPAVASAPTEESGVLPRLGSAITESAATAFQGLQRIGKAIQPYTPFGSVVEKIPGAIEAQEDVGNYAGGFARDVQDRAASDYGVDPNDQRFSSKVIKGASSLLPVVASGGTLAPITGAALAGESARQDAEARGATEGQQDATFALNAVIGAVTERLLGLPKILKMATSKGIAGEGLKALAARAALTAAKSSGMEATQESIQTLAENVIASDIVAYDPSRPIEQGVKDAALVGAVVGGGLGGVSGLGGQMGQSPEEQAQEQQEERQPVTPQDVQFTEQGTVIVDGKEHAVQDDVLKPVVPGSIKDKAIRSIVWEEPVDTPTAPGPLVQGEPATSDTGAERTTGENGPSFEATASFLRADESTGGSVPEESSSQQPRIAEWARRENRIIEDDALEALPIISNSTSEHEVRIRPSDNRVIKKTWPGFYGQIPVFRDGKLDRTAASPAQYLERQQLQNAVFGSDIKLEGVNVSERPSMVIGEPSGQPSFVVSQEFYTAAAADNPNPSGEQVEQFMGLYGFNPIPGSYFGFVRPSDGVVVVDAKPDNFVLTSEGVVPIDLQMARIPEMATGTGQPSTESPSTPATEAPAAEEAVIPPDSSTDVAPRETTPPPEPQATPQAEQSPTSIKNAVVDQERQKRGLPPAMQAARKEFGAVWDAAMQRLSNDPGAGRRLVEELTANPRPLTDEENAILLHRQVEAQNEFERAQESLKAATDEVQTADATARVNQASDDLLAIYNAGKSAGTEQGRGLVTRKLLANEDFTLAKMVTMRRAANGGKPLNKQQNAEIEALHKRITESEKKIAEYEEREKVREAKEEFQRLLSESKKEAKQTVKSGKGITDFLEDQAQKARERIIARRGKLFSTVDPLNVAGLVDEAIIGASYIAKGINNFADWSSRMVSDFGERIRPYLNELFERSKQYHDASSEIFKPSKPRKSPIQKASEAASAGGTLDPQLIYDLAREKVNAGMTELDAVMQAVQADLAPIFPDVTERQIRDAFSGYGKVTRPSQEADRVKLRELRRLGQLASAIEDAQKKVAPLKSGPQRDKATQKVRELQQELQRVMREQGIETASPEQQLASANTARATALRNQIEDIDKQLRTGDKKAKRPKVPDSPEVERLRSERDAMKALLDEIENPSKSPEQVQLERDKKAIQRRTKEIRDRIARNDYGPRPKKTPLMDDEKARLLTENRKAKDDFIRGLAADRIKNMTFGEKTWDKLQNALGLLRSLRFSFDLGAFGRQGGFVVRSRPITGFRSLGAMLTALKSEVGRTKVMDEIRNRENWRNGLYEQAKLFISDETEVKLSRLEEEYMSRWSRRIPGLAASERAHNTFLNRLRADTFDSLIELFSDGKPTIKEAQGIANYVNVATGRGSLGRYQSAVPIANMLVNSTSYYVSRLQLLTGQPLFKAGSARARKLVAIEYAKALTGYSIYYALLASAAGLLWPEDILKLETDPRSSNFGKVRIGKTVIDPMSGLAQFLVFASRVATGKLTSDKGESDLVNPKYGAQDIDKVIGRFIRSKFSPNMANAWDIATRRHFDRTKVTPTSMTAQMLPLSLDETLGVMQEHGLSKGAALTMLMMLGDSVDVYGKKGSPTLQMLGIEPSSTRNSQ